MSKAAVKQGEDELFIARADFSNDDVETSLSMRVVWALIISVALLIFTVYITTNWMARSQNDVASQNTRQMILGGVEKEAEKVRTLVTDYSLWTEAYNAVLAGDLDWIYPNMAVGTGTHGAVDLLIIVGPGGSPEYGWTDGSEKPTEGLLDVHAMRRVNALLDGSPLDDRNSRSTILRSNGQLWLVAVSRIMPWEGLPEGATDETLPRQIHGYRIDDDWLGKLGAPFLIDDLSVAKETGAEDGSAPLVSASGETVAHLTYRGLRPGDTSLNSIAVPLIVALALVCVAVLITARYAANSARRLERALNAAQQASRAKTNFLANLSHELKTPLNGVLGMSQILAAHDLQGAQREAVDTIIKSGKEQLALIDDLMHVSQIESGLPVLDFAPFDPKETVEEVVALTRPMAGQKGLEFKFEHTCDLPWQVIGDKVAFGRICSNLIGNAIKFTEAGFVTVNLDLSRLGDEISVVLSVSDSGPGIDPDEQNAIFDRFYQADDSMTRKADGAGLGLAITKSIVDAFGGSIKVESTPGCGACFTVTIGFEIASAMEQKSAA